ncbi:DUF2188 domain-containing protein [Aciduricibacillus chroicocephali]|uniref:DUF2188 domain-containing protein n=1 Tax=Aciduricibacillus chroicocephali TaxID=3054939 RepID=A0ABY9KWT4_9BACI|nr:DUF2188 domain-containing protein [Bacillaceae bacterium 44XB]
MNVNMYSVVPTPDMSSWIVKLEDAVPENQYNSQVEAIEAATKLAKDNAPSKIEVWDKNHNMIDKKIF